MLRNVLQKKRGYLRWMRGRHRAAYTVEASFVMPVVVWALALAMRLSLSLYEEVKSEAEQAYVVDVWAVEDFYRYQTGKEVFDDQS